MEGTAICRLAPFEVMEPACIPVTPANAYLVKHLKGRVSDVADHVWLARICHFALASASYLPQKAF